MNGLWLVFCAAEEFFLCFVDVVLSCHDFALVKLLKTKEEKSGVIKNVPLNICS
jgi:hypothetical protein